MNREERVVKYINSSDDFVVNGKRYCENDFYNDVEDLVKENKKYKEVIEKAIEYMKNNATSNYFDKEKNMFRREEDLLEILNEVE